ncbi:hypothetical protein [Persicobacter psychrovividus]|uniref:Phosphoribosyltransferase n=1 Tax=Persicobacter psychrovividus TaxID=387638 RepID=A0ABN6LEW8_9BACT|nr:hypothetical protein PEPS_21720 [Persicobacter psychrovividus]
MLKKIHDQSDCAIYAIDDQVETTIERYILSTPESRAICNDPMVMGLNYTRKLQKACASFFKGIAAAEMLALHERQSLIFNILRGGLNFSLREALADAYDWNMHGSAFISAQRRRVEGNSEEWEITEDGYKKVYFPANAQVVVGDVVATGTSLKHGLECMIDEAKQQQVGLKNIVFFTFGGPKTEEVMAAIDAECKATFPEYEKTVVCYIEGRFAIATPETPLSIKLTGTDLLRRDSLLAPEFLASQMENPAFPLERCTIYDAGSRAFNVPEYVEDVMDYWQQVVALAKETSYQALLTERCPDMDAADFGQVDLLTVAQQQVDKLKALGLH